MIRGIIGALVGIAVVYLFGAVVAWSFNPGEWGGFWRLWCVVWAILWAIGGAKFAYDVFTPNRVPRTLREDFGATRDGSIINIHPTRKHDF